LQRKGDRRSCEASKGWRGTGKGLGSGREMFGAHGLVGW